MESVPTMNDQLILRHRETPATKPKRTYFCNVQSLTEFGESRVTVVVLEESVLKVTRIYKANNANDFNPRGGQKLVWNYHSSVVFRTHHEKSKACL